MKNKRRTCAPSKISVGAAQLWKELLSVTTSPRRLAAFQNLAGLSGPGVNLAARHLYECNRYVESNRRRTIVRLNRRPVTSTAITQSTTAVLRRRSRILGLYRVAGNVRPCRPQGSSFLQRIPRFLTGMGVVDDRATPGDSARMQVDGVVFGERNFGGLPARSMCRGVCRSRRGGVRLVRRRDAQKVSKGSSESFEGTKSSGGSKGLGLRDPGKGSRVPRNRGEGRGGPKVKGLLDTNSYPKSPRGLWGPRGRRIVASDLRRLRLQQALGRELNLRLASPNLAQIRNIARGARRKSSVLLRVPKLLQQQRRSPLRGKLSRIGAQVAINIMCGFHRRNARLTAEQIAVVLNRASEQWPAMADVKFLLQVGSALNPGVVGTRVSIFGKVGAGTQTKVYAVACGNSAPDYDPAGRLTYGFAPAETYTGTFGIHVWLRSS